MDILIDFVSRFLTDRNEDDAFDRLNYQITPFLFVLLSLVNISKLYIGTAINCFTKAEFRGGWVAYAHDYCLVENTYYLRSDESIPVEQELRGQKRIAYYQWVPFILVLQACSFYAPHLLWQSFNWVTGYQIRAVVTAAKEAAAQPPDESRGTVRKIARSLFHASQLRHRTIRVIQEQKFVTLLYLAMKIAYLLLICAHLLLFKHFLGSLDFAMGFVRHRGEWEQTGHFPRVTVCDFTVYKYAQPMNFTVECVLPLNMFNEKIFVFFFFWLCLLLCLTVLSIVLWVGRVQTREWYFGKLIDIYARNEQRNTPDGVEESKRSLLASTDGSSIGSDSRDFSIFGSDLRVVLGLLQDQTGLVFCANVFREMCNIRDELGRAKSTLSTSPATPRRAISLSQGRPNDRQ